MKADNGEGLVMNWRAAYLTTAILCAISAVAFRPSWASVGINLFAGLFGGYTVRRLEREG